MTKFSKVTRVEVLEYKDPPEFENVRAYQNFNVKECEIALQDDGRTLKLFVYEKK
jgi:hypothetical protein